MLEYTAEQIQVVKDLAMLNAPGDQFSYSNIGYSILAEVVAAIVQMSVSEYFQHSIAKPAGLINSSWQVNGTYLDIQNRSECSNLLPAKLYDSYQPEHKGLYHNSSNAHDISHAHGSGNIISTARDLGRFNHALHRDHKLLPAKLYDMLLSPNMHNWGYGLRVKNGVVYSTGKFDSYTAHWLYIPECDLSVVMLSNVDEDEWSEESRRLEATKIKRGPAYIFEYIDKEFLS